MLDMPLEGIKCSIWFHGSKSFNPSYAGYASGSISLSVAPNRQSLVSILLMLDMPLEEITPMSRIKSSYCFNPSYAGYASGRLP